MQFGLPAINGSAIGIIAILVGLIILIFPHILNYFVGGLLIVSGGIGIVRRKCSSWSYLHHNRDHCSCISSYRKLFSRHLSHIAGCVVYFCRLQFDYWHCHHRCGDFRDVFPRYFELHFRNLSYRSRHYCNRPLFKMVLNNIMVLEGTDGKDQGDTKKLCPV
jgi:hypothetical protein